MKPAPALFIAAISGSLLLGTLDVAAAEPPGKTTHPAKATVPDLLNGPPTIGRIGRVSDSLKVLKVIDDRQVLVRAYWQSHGRRPDKKPVTVLVPVLLLLRGVSTADLKVGGQLKVSQVFEVTTDYQVGEYFPNLALVLEPVGDE